MDFYLPTGKIHLVTLVNPRGGFTYTGGGVPWGVIIDERLEWKNHIDICKNKLLSGIYAINSFNNAIPTIQLKTLYYTLIHPYLTYGVLLWGGALKKHIHKLQVLQNKTLQI